MNVMKYIRYIFILTVAALSALYLQGCTEVQEPDYREQDYGHVQFKLYKEASCSGTKAMVSELDFLHDVSKVKVTLKYGENLLTQTLVMNVTDDASAEFGIRSDKLKLLAGAYEVVLFTLFDKQDQPLYEAAPSAEMASFEVVAGGFLQRQSAVVRPDLPW